MARLNVKMPAPGCLIQTGPPPALTRVAFGEAWPLRGSGRGRPRPIASVRLPRSGRSRAEERRMGLTATAR